MCFLRDLPVLAVLLARGCCLWLYFVPCERHQLISVRNNAALCMPVPDLIRADSMSHVLSQ